jgi:hypothetical protein
MSNPSIKSPRPTAYQSTFRYISSVDRSIIEHLQADAYMQGKKDGIKEMEIELIKRGKALFDMAFQKMSIITGSLVKVAEENDIVLYDFHLKVENWDKINSLIIVKLEDFVDDKIDALYKAANDLADEINTDSFTWAYSITYNSEDLSLEKILSDGFEYLYEHTPKPRNS